MLNDGFNPRPHQGAGATSLGLSVKRFSEVSILARTKARALQFASNVMSNNV